MFAGTGIFWREGRGEYPGRSAGDAGMVPLSSRETAKGGEKETQLAALRQVFPLLQRSHLGAKRNQIPGSGTPARILTAGNWLYKKEEKQLFEGEDAAKVWLGVKRIERWFLLNNQGVTGKIKSGIL